MFKLKVFGKTLVTHESAHYATKVMVSSVFVPIHDEAHGEERSREHLKETVGQERVARVHAQLRGEAGGGERRAPGGGGRWRAYPNRELE